MKNLSSSELSRETYSEPRTASGPRFLSFSSSPSVPLFLCGFKDPSPTGERRKKWTTEEEPEGLGHVVAGDASGTENRIRPEVWRSELSSQAAVPRGVGQRGRQDADGLLKRAYVRTSKGREITTALLAARQADVHQRTKSAAWKSSRKCVIQSHCTTEAPVRSGVCHSDFSGVAAVPRGRVFKCES